MKVENISISEIKPYEKNPRNNKLAVDKVAASIKEFGFKQPIVVDKDGVIIAGHTRFKAAKQLGYTEVPVLYAEDLSDEQVKAYRLADNKTAEFAEWDEEFLNEELNDLKNSNFDMTPFGFEIIDKEVEEDDFNLEENLPENPVSKQGDIWLLGKHRLMCGDSTSREDVLKLMGDSLADMIFTDPPYNVNYEGGSGLKIQNDSMSDGKFYNFLFDAYTQMYNSTKPGGAIYVCHADSEGINFRKALKDAGFELKQCIVWIKNALVMGRQDHHWQHEPILYGWKPGAAHRWYGGRKQTTVIQQEDGVFVNKNKGGFQLTFNNGIKKVVVNVPSFDVVSVSDDTVTTTWKIDKPLKNGERPTMKPIKLCARAIENSSKPGDIVLDLFGGSGSTLIACEQTERICYTMELDEKYADVIVARYEKFTGEKAVLLGVQG